MDGFAEGYAVGQGNNNNAMGYGAGMWGQEWIWIIVLFLFWGRNGWGNGNNAGGGSEMLGYELGKVATTNDVAAGFNNSAVLSSLNDLKLGQAGLQQTLCQGFGGVNTAIVQNGYETRLGINDLGYRMQDCCCKTNNNITSGFADISYRMAKDTCDIQNTINSSTRDIVDSQREGTAAILNFLTQDKISTLQSENQALKFQASQTAQNAFISANQQAQTAELIRRLGRDCPVPAYVVPNPNCCYGTPVGVMNNGCGGTCGCA